MSARMDAAEGALGCVLWLVGMFALIAASTVTDAWALWLLWRWFVVPAFGLAPLGFWTAAGLQLAYLALRGQVATGTPADGAAPIKWAAYVINIIVTRPLFLVGIGYVVHALAEAAR